ncbi:hypothetical protein JMJ77_0001021 [Colletotrichum scovillei]|uniref:Uncharacterized protein n=1 Tax=Colletotrichum scovillei TaxID=1209932 RepID=A0A9P7RBA2_9PEZI|nr:hypothetical protein JMJ77_0001021 [Colletotrichum scovillei]KAG7072241.1 hypothetical protein JMJ76_0005097 [Colletotrichum scovillei]KAG7080354.1 hypothetical protein JMJ78_0007450 [Colletotrichum scovillei]
MTAARLRVARCDLQIRTRPCLFRCHPSYATCLDSDQLGGQPRDVGGFPPAEFFPRCRSVSTRVRDGFHSITAGERRCRPRCTSGSPNTSAWEAGIHPMGLRLCDTTQVDDLSEKQSRAGSVCQKMRRFSGTITLFCLRRPAQGRLLPVHHGRYRLVGEPCLTRPMYHQWNPKDTKTPHSHASPYSIP